MAASRTAAEATPAPDGDSDEGTETEASVYLTPELNDRHVVLDRRRLYKQHRLMDSQDRRPFSKNSSRSISTDDDECYFSSAEAPPINRLESRLYMLAMISGGDVPLDDPSGMAGRRKVGGDTIHENTTEDFDNRMHTVDAERRSNQVGADVNDYQIHVSRPAYTVPQLRHDLCYLNKTEQGLVSSAKEYLRSCFHCSPGSLWALLLLRLPVLAWLPRYSFRRDCAADFVAGCTVAIMHLPQGMAYAMLAEVPPIYGLYTAFFPVLAYAIFGTSRHISMGTFAVACLMTGKVVGELSTSNGHQTSRVESLALASTAVLGSVTDTVEVLVRNTSESVIIGNLIPEDNDYAKDSISQDYNFAYSSPGNYSTLIANATESFQESVSGTFGPTVGSLEDVTGEGFEPIQVAVAVSLFVGIWQMVFGLLQLGQVCVFLSDMLISGFTTGAACHVLSSQVKHILGIKVQRYSGPFRLIYTYIDIIKMLQHVNPAAIIMSVICITVLVINNEILKPRLKKHTNFPVPIEMIVVIVSTAVAYLSQMERTYDLRVVGEIPTGLPRPSVPDSRLFAPVLMDTFVLAIVIYAISFSMAKIFSKKHGYPVDPTQELYAGGLSNIFGSLFSSVPSAASLSRSLIQESVGGKTQVTSFFSCALILIILLFVGPIFESLPTCVLASIIVVALKGMFLQVHDLQKMWKQSRVDSMLWLVTFLVTVLIDIDYGLASGVLFSLMLLLKRNNQPTVKRVGWVPNTDIYVDIDAYQSAVSLPGARLCRVFGALHFANRDSFRAELARATGLDITLIIAAKMKRDKKIKSSPDPPRGDFKHQQQQRGPPTESDKARAQDKKEKASTEDNNQRNNLTKKVMKDAFLNVVRGNSSYSGDKTEQPMKGDPLGIHNEAYLADELYEEYHPHTSPAHPFHGPPSKPDHCSIVISEITMVVLCLSGVGWIDVAAAKQLAALFSDYSAAGITMTLAGVNDSLMEVMHSCGVFASIPENRFFHTIHDAVTFLMPVMMRQATKWNPKSGSLIIPSKPNRTVHLTTHDARPAVMPQSGKVTFGSSITVPTVGLPHAATLHDSAPLHAGALRNNTQTEPDSDAGIRKRENTCDVDETINTIT